MWLVRLHQRCSHDSEVCNPAKSIWPLRTRDEDAELANVYCSGLLAQFKDWLEEYLLRPANSDPVPNLQQLPEELLHFRSLSPQIRLIHA